MKIFNWVHRCRFNRHKAENAKTSGGEEQILLDNTLLEAFDGWKGGILAIGTFGYDCLRGGDDDNEEYAEEECDHVYKEESEKEMSDDSDEDEINSEDEVIPLVVYAANYNAHDYEGLMEGNRVFPNIGFEEGAKKERKTLAELFYAESDEKVQEKEAMKKREGVDVKKKWNNKHAATLSFAKKLIREDAHRPIQKMHRLMRRMLKRKIHPADMGLNKQNPVDDSEVVVKNRENSGFTSFLPTQDALV